MAAENRKSSLFIRV